MENIVYLLGVGFSAPLGLPVMGNFLEKGRDLYFTDQKKYKNFEKIESLLRELSYQKNFILSYIMSPENCTI